MLEVNSACARRYGFVEPAFVDAPDGRFLYRSASLTHALAEVLDRIGRGDRTVVVTGDAGIGKTTLCVELSRHLAADAVTTRGRAVKVVDDAHLLDATCLREHLSTPSAADERGTQTILVGQPCLGESLENVNPAIAWIRLGALQEHEIAEYIERRMWVARGGVERFREPTVGGADKERRFASRPRFSARAVRRLAGKTDGNPRAVNVMCAQAIEHAALRAVWATRLAWCTIPIAIVALAMMPSVHSKQSSAVAGPQTSSTAMQSADSFDGFRRTTLQRAAELAAAPDVNGLLRIRAGVVSRASGSSDPRQAVVDLLKEIDRLTNDARARQLQIDHRQMLEYVKQR